MTAERAFAPGTVTDTGVIATSSAVPNAPSGPLRCSVNVAVVTEGALSSRLKPAVIEAGNASTVEFGAGDSDVTRIGPAVDELGCAPSAIHCRTMLMSACGTAGRPAGMRSPTRGRAFELLDQIAVVRIARGDAQGVRALDARHADEQHVAVRGIEAQADRRVSAGMTMLAERLEDVGLNRVEVRRQRADRAAAALKTVAGATRRERAAGQGYEQARCRAAADRKHSCCFLAKVPTAYECRGRPVKVHSGASPTRPLRGRDAPAPDRDISVRAAPRA